MRNHIRLYFEVEDFRNIPFTVPNDCVLNINGNEYFLFDWEEVLTKYGEVLDGTIKEGLEVNLLRI